MSSARRPTTARRPVLFALLTSTLCVGLGLGAADQSALDRAKAFDPLLAGWMKSLLRSAAVASELKLSGEQCKRLVLSGWEVSPAELLDGAQMDRLREIALQWAAHDPEFFLRPEVASAIGLAPEQERAIGRILVRRLEATWMLEPLFPRTGDLFDIGIPAPIERALDEVALGEIAAVLTADQRARWAGFLGKRFDEQTGMGTLRTPSVPSRTLPGGK